MNRTQDKIIKCLREHGGEINPSRGYTAVVKLAQRMRLDHNDRAILEDVTDSLQALERDGRVVIDWANNRAHASSIMLIEEDNTEPEPEKEEATDSNTTQTVEERVNALITRLREVKLDAANAEFELALAKARADEAETMALEESARADQAERDRDRQLERVSTLEARIAKLESDLEEALSSSRPNPPTRRPTRSVSSSERSPSCRPSSTRPSTTRAWTTPSGVSWMSRRTSLEPRRTRSEFFSGRTPSSSTSSGRPSVSSSSTSPAAVPAPSTADRMM